MKVPHSLSSVFLAAALASSIAGIGCGDHHAYRVYDAYYTDYHEWNRGEIVYYQRWADKHHRDRDFRKLSNEEQKEYWTWRHNHGDHDRDQDRDRDRDKDHR